MCVKLKLWFVRGDVMNITGLFFICTWFQSYHYTVKIKCFFFLNDHKKWNKSGEFAFFHFLIQSVIIYLLNCMWRRYKNICYFAISFGITRCLSNLNDSPQRWNSPVLQNFLFFFLMVINHQFFSNFLRNICIGDQSIIQGVVVVER